MKNVPNSLRRSRGRSPAVLALAACAALTLTTVAVAQSERPERPTGGAGSLLDQLQMRQVHSGNMPIITIETEPVEVFRYADGSRDMRPSFLTFRYICGTDPQAVSMSTLETFANDFLETYVDEPVVIVGGERGTGFDVSFNTDGTVPGAAIAALADAEAYLESTFDNNSTLTVDISYANLGGGIIGATFSSSLNDSYSDSRNGLVNGMDPDDVIQDWLPTTNFVPVRYNGSFNTITNEFIVFWNRANYRATVGAVGGLDGSITFNSTFNFDYNPANGVFGTSFIDVAVHEFGHAMGFVSKVDDGTPDVDALDLFRFQRTDGGNDYNPDTFQEFQDRPRLVDFNNPNDQHISDVITAEYRMEDGSPNQASHFRDQFPSFALMDPTIGSGTTNFPNYFTTADLTMFDAIGWYYPPGCPAEPFTQQPPAQVTSCAGEPVIISAQAIWASSFEWRFNGGAIDPNDPNYGGVDTNTLVIVNPSPALAGTYTLIGTDVQGCTTESDPSELTVAPFPLITTQPEPSQTVCAGADVTLVADALPGNVEFQWFKGATPLVDAPGEISGATGEVLTLFNVDASDTGTGADAYFCRVTNPDGGCSRDTNDAEVIVLDPQFTSQPSDLAVEAGQPASFSVTVADSNGLSYQWLKDGAPLVNDGRITGVDTDTLSIDPTEVADAGVYSVEISYAPDCSALSNGATLTIDDPQDCVGDLTGDGTVSGADLNILLSEFGQPCATPPDCQGADFDGNGDVNGADLNVLLSAFGPCP